MKIERCRRTHYATREAARADSLRLDLNCPTTRCALTLANMSPINFGLGEVGNHSPRNQVQLIAWD